MSDQINRTTMEIHKSVNTPNFPQNVFLNISGMALPECEDRYWKIVGEQVIEMTKQEKADVDYIPPPPTPDPPTPEEIEETRLNKIQTKIEKTHPHISREMVDLWKALAEEIAGNAIIDAHHIVILAAEALYPPEV